MLDQPGQPGQPREAVDRHIVERCAERGGGAGADDRHLREGLRHVAELHVLGEHELLQFGQDGVLHRQRHRQQHHIAELIDEQIGDHPPLRGEVAGVAPEATLDGDDVVGQQPLQIRRPVGAGDGDAAAS